MLRKKGNYLVSLVEVGYSCESSPVINIPEGKLVAKAAKHSVE
jgi:hypothetical protein